MLKRFRYSIFALLAISALTASMVGGCTQEPKTIKIPYVQWACAEAESFLAQEILEDMGYEVELSTVQAGVMWSSVATGDSDFFTTAWLPYTHKSYWEEYGDQVDRIGSIYEGAVLALVVPDYVTIDSIAEMKDHEEEFGGRIVGIDPGAGIMEATKDAVMPEYGLEDWQLVESSGPAMISELESAINDEEWIAVTGWAPHWKFFAYDLKMLEDPEKAYGGLETIEVIAREGFRDDFPDVGTFLENMFLTSDQLGEIMYYINVEEMSGPEAASTWIEDNQDLVDSWLP